MTSCFYTSVVQNYGQLLVRGYYNGERFSEKVKYKPYLFIKSNTEKSIYTDHKGEHSLSRVDFDSIKDAKEFMDRYSDVDNFHIFGMSKFQYTYINDEYPDGVAYDIKQMSVVSIDIEVASDNGFPYPESASNEVTAITLSKDGKYYVFGCGDYVTTKPNVFYAKCYSEEHLLHKFLDFWKILDPDIVTGWNVELFDVPYLYNRIKNVLNEENANAMSPWGNVFEREVNQKYGKGLIKVLNGITIFDYMTLYKKFSNTPQENYRLNTVASYELKLGKIDYTGSLLDLYKTDYQKFIDYNIRDVELVVLMEEKLKFIELACAIAYDAKVNLTDALSTVNLWDVIIHNYLLKQNKVIPFQKFEGSVDSEGSIQGGYVKEPQIGYHEWVVSWDFDSLYPHIAMMMNISPDTFEYIADYDDMFYNVDQLLRDGLSADIQSSIAFSDSAYAANHAIFRRDKQGFFSALMENMYVDRQKYKKMMVEAKKAYEKDKSFENEKKIAQYNAFQHAKKIQLNSAYGALANKYFRWFDHRLAEAITITGQYCIRYIEMQMNKYLNNKFNTSGVDYVIASDTDSVYVKFDVKDKINEKEINKKIDEWCQEIYHNLNAYKPALKMKRESIACNAIWTGKKHYVLNVIDLEGVEYKEPKLKLQGIEAVKSSTPTAVRGSMIDAIKIIMGGTEDALIDFVTKTKKEFTKKPYEDISFPRSVNDLDKYYDRVTLWAKGTPIQVKGSLVYNDYIKKKGLNYPAISDASKIKFCYLKTPNPLRSEVIATPNELPEEFGLARYIDYDTQFSKAFMQPIQSIADQRNWKLERRNTLF